MAEYVQIGTTALRDPVTGEFCPAVPLYVRASDLADQPAHGVNLASVAMNLAGKMRDYRRQSKKEGLE